MTFSKAEKILRDFGYYLYQKRKTRPGEPVAYYDIQRIGQTPGILEPPTLVSSLTRIKRFIEDLVEAKEEGVPQRRIPTEDEIMEQLNSVKINMRKFRATFRKYFPKMTHEQRKGYLSNVKFNNSTFNEYFWPNFPLLNMEKHIDSYLLARSYALFLENITWKMKQITGDES